MSKISKKTKLITIFSLIIIGIVISLIILTFTIFKVKNIEISQSKYMTNDNRVYLNNQALNKIKTSSMAKENQIIFNLDTKKIAKNIEIANSSIHVLAIERKFPNTVVIHVTNKVPIISLSIANSDKIALLDREFYVTKIINKNNNNEYYKPIKVEGLEIKESDYKNGLEGQKIRLSTNEAKFIYKTVKGLEKIGIADQKMGNFINKINLSSNSLIQLETNTGVSLIIQPGLESKISIEQQIHRIYSVYEHYRTSINEEDRVKIYNGYIKPGINGWYWAI